MTQLDRQLYWQLYRQFCLQIDGGPFWQIHNYAMEPMRDRHKWSLLYSYETPLEFYIGDT